MITEDYVSFETAKLLKEKGFKHWCGHCYGVDVRHKGESISFDEECDLKDEGFGNEIEYIDGGRLYDCGCNNSDKDAKVWAAPTLWAVMKWLREVHNLHIMVDCIGAENYIPTIQFTRNSKDIEIKSKISKIGGNGFDSNEQAIDAAINYCLENLI